MKVLHRSSLVAAGVIAAMFSASAFATNGYFAHGYSMAEKGLAGAGVAFSQDSLAGATNPAGMVMVGSRTDLGLSLFSPNREYEVKGGPSPTPGSCPGNPGTCPFSLAPGTYESDNTAFLIPSFGYNHMLDAKSSIGISVYGNGGMNTEYTNGKASSVLIGGQKNGTYGGGDAGVDLGQVFFTTTYARKYQEASSIGVSAIIAYQWFEAKGLSNFANFSQSSSDLSGNDHDKSWGYGAKFGVQQAVSKGFTLGASYQTKINMQAFDDYKGLFAQQGSFDIPATGTIGLAAKPTPTSTFVLDVQKIWYSKVDSVGNSFNPAFNSCAGTVFSGGSASSNSNCLGGNNGVGFGWDDMTVVKLGFQWESSPGWNWRIGYSKTKQPIGSSEVLFNILAPAVVEEHYTFGFTTEVAKNNELTFAAMYAPENEVSGPNPLDPSQKITLRMYQYDLGVSWAWKF